MVLDFYVGYEYLASDLYDRIWQTLSEACTKGDQPGLRIPDVYVHEKSGNMAVCTSLYGTALVYQWIDTVAASWKINNEKCMKEMRV